MVHLVPDGRFEDGQHFRRQPAAQTVGAKGAEAHADECGDSTDEHEGLVHRT